MKLKYIAAAAAMLLASPVMVHAESADSPDGTIVIEEVSENGGIRKGDSGEIVNEKWGTSIEAGYEVVFVGDAYLSPAGAENVPSLIVDASKYGGELIIHKGNNSIDGPAESITLKADDLSPVIVLAKRDSQSKGEARKASPSTGDDGHLLPYVALCVSMVALVLAIINSREN